MDTDMRQGASREGGRREWGGGACRAGTGMLSPSRAPVSNVMLSVAVILGVSGVLLAATTGEVSHLDRLFNRLDEEGAGSEVPPTLAPAPVTFGPPPPAPHHRVRHGHLPPPEYEEEEEEDQLEEEPPPQADRAHRRLYTTSGAPGKPNHPVRSGTKLGRPDWDSLTSKKNLKEAWRSYNPVSSAVASNGEADSLARTEARSHTMKMSLEGSCRHPQPKIIRVSDHYPSVSATYVPSCTRLHVCAEDTGCCGPAQKCGPKASHKLELYFYVTYHVPGFSGHHDKKALKIEKLTFFNHTECECQDRTDEMPRDTEPRVHTQVNSIPNQPAQFKKCKCPSEYTVRYFANGSCSCDCFDKQRDCTKYKKGKEQLSYADKLCIQMRVCTIPSCDYGDFNKKLGRCPKKNEKFKSWSRYKV